MMKQPIRRFAPIGLYLAGLALLAAVGLYIVYQTFSLPIQISLGVAVLGLALYVLLDPQRTREALTGRQARYGSNALLMSIAFIGILVVINYLAANNSRHWDLTDDKTNSLAPESIEALSTLKEPVKVDAYYLSTSSVESTRDLLQNFKINSGGKFDYEFIDPNTDPVRAQQANITRDATLVVNMGDRAEQLTYPSEEELTGAIIRLANPGERAVYFLSGHGEFTPEGGQDRSLGLLVTRLKTKNYTTNTLNLLADRKIPEDALAVVIAGPTKPISQEEADLIKAYMDQGGSLVYLSEPRPLTEFGEAEDPMASYLLTDWGLKLDEDMVIDMSSNQLGLAIAQRYGNTPITQKMMSQAIILPGARTVQIEQAPEGVTLNELAYASDMAWGETDYASLQSGNVTQDEGKDIFGPVPLAVSGTNSGTSARVVVIGDADFTGDQAFNSYGNSDFMMNSIDWAAEQESLLNLTTNEPTQRVLVPPQGYVLGLILLGSVFLLPGLVVITGVSTWIQRKRRG